MFSRARKLGTSSGTTLMVDTPNIFKVRAWAIRSSCSVDRLDDCMTIAIRPGVMGAPRLNDGLHRQSKPKLEQTV
jgi:hypothetical protein